MNQRTCEINYVLLNQLIEELDYSQAQLARLAGVSRTNLGRILSGRLKYVQTNTIMRISSTLNLTEKEMLDVFFSKDKNTSKLVRK